MNCKNCEDGELVEFYGVLKCNMCGKVEVL